MLWYRWARFAGMTEAVARWRAWAAPARDLFPEWALFSLPDGAWVFACTAFFARLWPDGPWWLRATWIGMGSVLAVGGEVGQAVGLVPGTFDPIDVVAYLSAAGLALVLVRSWPRHAAR